MAEAVVTLPAVRRPANTWQTWGRLLVVPYLLIFVIFVVYPVGYGLYLARDPQNYTRLFADPVFFRTAINTVIFVVVSVNVKMCVWSKSKRRHSSSGSPG